MVVYHSKQRSLLKTVAFCSSSLLCYTLSQSANSTTLTPEQIDALIAETRSLRQEVSELKKQLNDHTHASSNVSMAKPSKPKTTKSIAVKSQSTTTIKKIVSKPLTSKAPQPKPKPSVSTPPILLAPYLGDTPSFDGSDLIANLPQPNSDLLALQFRQQYKNGASKNAIQDSNYFLVLSGALGTQMYTMRPYTGPKSSDIDLTNFNFAGLAGIGKWITAYFSTDYDSTPAVSLTPMVPAPRIGNSRMYLDQGFITIGNLDETDWYLSAGQMYLPFGSFNGYMVNSPLTSSLFSTEERPLLLGYSHTSDDGNIEFDVQAYTFNGETIRTPNEFSINEWGLNVDSLFTGNNWNAELGAGYISNIADSEGIQNNGQISVNCTIFGGFAFPCNTGNLLAHGVPGFDVHGSLTYGPYTILGEYLTATRRFAPFNLSYNGNGAKPSAFDIEAGYSFSVWNRPSSFSVGYTVTQQSLALLLPAEEFAMALSTAIWRNTTQSIGYQRDFNYGFRDFATGQNLPVVSASNPIGLGRISDTVILAMNVSF